MADYRKYTDQELLQRLRKSDERAYGQLYERYWAVLFAHARNMLRDDEEAKDVVQDIYTRLWEGRAALQADLAIKPYLYSAVRNQSLNHINRSRVKERYLESLADYFTKGSTVTDEQVIYRDLTVLIEQGIDSFSPRMKQVFELSRKAGMSNKAIADELQISEGAVKKTIGRALKVLRGHLSSFLLFL